MLTQGNTAGLNSLANLYFFGQPSLPEAEKSFDFKKYYDKDELNELELDSRYKESFKHRLFNLNTDWDSFQGSMRNSSLGFFDAFFSSFGASLSQALSDKAKLLVNLASFGSAFIPRALSINDKISMFQLGGRLIRAPLHIFDSFFSVSGESLASNQKMSIANLALGFAGLAFSYGEDINKDKASDLDYQSISGTIGRSSLHNFQSMASSFAQKIFDLSPILGSLITLAIPSASILLPKQVKDISISWKSLPGLLSQNLFSFSDSINSAFGHLLSKKVMSHPFLSLMTAAPAVGALALTDAKKLLSKKLLFTKLDTKLLRSSFHILDTLALNFGTAFAKSKLSIPFMGLYGALTYFSSLSKSELKLPDFKIQMNTVQGLVQRLGFDFIEATISEKSNLFAKRIPAPIMLLFGPAISFKLGELFKEAKTNFNSSSGLMLKHLIHFWDNIMTASGASLANSLTSLIAKPKDSYTGNQLSDGRWLTSSGRIVQNMALGKQLFD